MKNSESTVSANKVEESHFDEFYADLMERSMKIIFEKMPLKVKQLDQLIVRMANQGGELWGTQDQELFL